MGAASGCLSAGPLTGSINIGAVVGYNYFLGSVSDSSCLPNETILAVGGGSGKAEILETYDASSTVVSLELPSYVSVNIGESRTVGFVLRSAMSSADDPAPANAFGDDGAVRDVSISCDESVTKVSYDNGTFVIDLVSVGTCEVVIISSLHVSSFASPLQYVTSGIDCTFRLSVKVVQPKEDERIRCLTLRRENTAMGDATQNMAPYRCWLWSRFCAKYGPT